MVQDGSKKMPSNAPNLLSLAVLFLSFSITLFSQQSLTQAQKNIAYAYLVGAGLYVILAILPQSITNFMKNKYVIVISYLAANLAWFFTFAMKWLDGIKNTGNVESQIIATVGAIFLLAVVVITTRYLKELTKVREVGLLLPIGIAVFSINTLINTFNIFTLIYLLLYVIACICVVYTKWRPGGDLPFIPGNK